MRVSGGNIQTSDSPVIAFTASNGLTLAVSEAFAGKATVALGGSILRNYAVAQQTGFATDTYLTGSAIAVPSAPAVGWLYTLTFGLTKTAAGIATPIIAVRFGTAGTTADTALLTFTFAAGTAAIDTGVFTVRALFRTVGATTTAVLAGDAQLVSNLTATGISNAVKALQVVSSGFDSTVASSIIGASYNGGTSAAHTVELVASQLQLV